MNFKHLSVAVAIVAGFSVPALAQTGGGTGAAGSPAPASTSVNVDKNTGSQAPAPATSGVSSGTGVAVTSGTGIAVAPSAPLSPSPQPRILPGGAVVPYHSTTVVGGPAPGITSSTIVTTYSWVNVPADAASRGEFHRWQALK